MSRTRRTSPFDNESIRLECALVVLWPSSPSVLSPAQASGQSPISPGLYCRRLSTRDESGIVFGNDDSATLKCPVDNQVIHLQRGHLDDHHCQQQTDPAFRPERTKRAALNQRTALFCVLFSLLQRTEPQLFSGSCRTKAPDFSTGTTCK